MIKPGQIRFIVEQNNKDHTHEFNVDWEAVANEINDLVMTQLEDEREPEKSEES